jgi:hypothetical protein
MPWPKGKANPANAKVTDEEFVSIWQRCGGKTADVERETGLSHAKMFERRRAIEKRQGIVLASSSDKLKQVVHANRAVVSLEISDGVIIVVSDAHYFPGPASTAHRGAVELTRRLKPGAFIMNGDAFDGATISRFPTLNYDKRPSVKEELEAVKERLGEIEAAAPPGCRLIWPAGNHDCRWTVRLVNAVPEYAGALPDLKDIFPEWTPCWRIDVNDDVVIRHREQGGVHAGHNNAMRSIGKTVVTGHDHQLCVTPVTGYGGTVYGVRTGMLADDAEDAQFLGYLEGKRPSWISGGAVLTFRNGKLLYPELFRKHDDEHIEFRGELIKV